MDWIDSQKKPYAQYVFKYRSLGKYRRDLLRLIYPNPVSAALRALSIVPRSPSPVPLEDRPAAELSEAEVRELVEIQRVGPAWSALKSCEELR